MKSLSKNRIEKEKKNVLLSSLEGFRKQSLINDIHSLSNGLSEGFKICIGFWTHASWRKGFTLDPPPPVVQQHPPAIPILLFVPVGDKKSPHSLVLRVVWMGEFLQVY